MQSVKGLIKLQDYERTNETGLHWFQYVLPDDVCQTQRVAIFWQDFINWKVLHAFVETTMCAKFNRLCVLIIPKDVLGSQER